MASEVMTTGIKRSYYYKMYLIEFGPQLFNKNIKKQNLYHRQGNNFPPDSSNLASEIGSPSKITETNEDKYANVSYSFFLTTCKYLYLKSTFISRRYLAKHEDF